MTNYKKSGAIKQLAWGGPATAWDVHVIAWQQELVDAELIEPKEMWSPASIRMTIGWILTNQSLNSIWKINKTAWCRLCAVQAGWLLTMDLVKLEELNYKDVTTLVVVTTESEQEPADSV